MAIYVCLQGKQVGIWNIELKRLRCVIIVEKWLLNIRVAQPIGSTSMCKFVKNYRYAAERQCRSLE